MKAVHAWSAHELGGKRAPPETLFDLASPDRPSRSGTGSFEHALKDLIKMSRNETGSLEEPQDMRRSVDSQDGTPVPIQAPPNPDWSEPARTIVQVRNEAAPSALADASGMGSRPENFSVGNMAHLLPSSSRVRLSDLPAKRVFRFLIRPRVRRQKRRPSCQCRHICGSPAHR